VTPLPDDVLLVPLGMIGYNSRVLMVSIFVGKTVLATFLAYAGFYGVDYFSSLFEASGWSSIIISVLLLLGGVIALLRVNWEKVIDEM
jgi:membrane protein DedA with SNARE-associated domain